MKKAKAKAKKVDSLFDGRDEPAADNARVVVSDEGVAGGTAFGRGNGKGYSFE